MNFADEAWKFWSEEHFPPAAPDYRCGRDFGTYWEPDSSLWCASLLEPARDRLVEPFTVLDWGFGDGRLFDFLSKRFRYFYYYGLERPGDYGAKCVRTAQKMFEGDGRAEFDLCGSLKEGLALASAGVAVLGSVATHLPFQDFEVIMQGLMPLLEHDGVVVSSLFIDEKYELKGGGYYGHEDCYGEAFYTQKQVDDLCFRLGLVGEEKETFFAQPKYLHRIYLMSKRPMNDGTK